MEKGEFKKRRAEGEKLGLEFMWIGEIRDLLPYGMEVNNHSSNFTALI